MRVDAANLLQFRLLGVEALYRELDPVAMILFLQQYKTARQKIARVHIHNFQKKSRAGASPPAPPKDQMIQMTKLSIIVWTEQHGHNSRC